MGDICEAGVCPAGEVITGHGNGKRKPREMKEEGARFMAAANLARWLYRAVDEALVLVAWLS
jgi:hypothetical protein